MKLKKELTEWLCRPRVATPGLVINLTSSEIEKNSFTRLFARTGKQFCCNRIACAFGALLFSTLLSPPSLIAAEKANLASSVLRFAEQKVIPDDGVGNDGFGYAVARSGTTSMVGEAKATINGNEAQGEVDVFTRMGSLWILTQKLTANDGAADDVFGSSISLSGDTAIIGAIEANNDRGAVYVFKRSGDTWVQKQKITASDGAQLDWFGYSVAFSGKQLVVGARNARGDRGAAYFYEGSSGTWVLTTELSPADLQPQDYFGAAVALSGATALIGAFDINGHTAGEAYIFSISNTSRVGWIQTQKLIPSDGHPGDWFGWSVALSDDTAVIGANLALINNNTNQGAVYVFSRSGGLWIESQKLLASDGAEFGVLGQSVAIDGETIVAGAPGHPAAYLFTRTYGVWSQKAELIASDYSTAGGSFGREIALDGDTSLVSSAFSMVNGNPEGAAYFYRLLLGQLR